MSIETQRPVFGLARRAAPLAFLLLLWLGLGGLDWVMRFRWFQWHRSFVAGTFKPRYMGDWAPLSTRTYGPSHGGDLSRLLVVPDAMERWALDRPAGGEVRADEFGLPNDPPTTNQYYPVVLVGDSYLVQGRAASNLPAQRLARLLGTSVYTVAHAGRGAVFALSGFVDHPHFRSAPPQTLLWCIAERDTSGYFFDSMATEVMRRVFRTNFVANVESTPRSAIYWRALAPARLRSSLPNTSLIAQFARRKWTELRYRAFGRLNDDVLFSSAPVGGHRLLFYRPNLDALYWSPAVRDVPKMARVAEVVQREYFQPRGIRWVIVLIPEKERVYQSVLPAGVRARRGDVPPPVFDALESGLREAGIGVVNLLKAFAPAAARGELLYWPDDTHWNDAGMELAAEAIRDELQQPGAASEELP